MGMRHTLHVLTLGLAFGSVASRLSTLGIGAEFTRPRELPNSGPKSDVYKMHNAQAQYLKHHQPARK